MEKFTASEVTTLEQVRNWCENHERFETPNTLGEICAVLGAAITTRDAVLEAQERAVPVATVRRAETGGYWIDWRGKQMPDYLGCNLYTHPAPADVEPPSSLQEALCVIEAAALRGVTLHGDDIPRLRATVDKIAPGQTSADTEMLAEALRKLTLQWRSANPHGTDKPMTVGAKIAYTWCAEQIEEILSAHSAKAQPPAASVTDAMQELADKYHELLWAVARKFPGETRHETALRYIREAECQEAALAAQENPNGV